MLTWWCGGMWRKQHHDASLYFVSSVAMCQVVNGHVPGVGGRSGCHTTIDYGNAVLTGLPVYLSRRLQSVLNAAARWSSAYDVQTTLFKVAVLTYKVLHGWAPSYLGPFVRVGDLPSRRALRSANTSRLIQPQSNRSTVSDRAFPVAGPQVWNSLPPEVTSAPSLLDTFRRRLKTRLFTVSYSNIQLS